MGLDSDAFVTADEICVSIRINLIYSPIYLFFVFLYSMPRHYQPFKPSGFQRGPLQEHGEDLHQLHRGPGEPGGHLHGGAPGPVLPHGKDCYSFIAAKGLTCT